LNHSIFALELCMRLVPRSRLRDDLRRLVIGHPAATGPREKADLLHRITTLLADSDDLYEKGCWDFFDDDERARSDYDMWCKGMTTEEGARLTPSGFPERYGEHRYMTFTIALLMVNGSKSERALAKLCETPQEMLWRKETFVRILRGLPLVDYEHVKSDVLYLIPGEEDWGLTAEDLTAEKFEYLRKVE